MAYNNVFHAYQISSVDALQGDHVLFMGAIMDADFAGMFVNNSPGSLNIASSMLFASLDASLKAQFNAIAQMEYTNALGGNAPGSERGAAQAVFLQRRPQTLHDAAKRSMAVLEQFRQQLCYARTRAGVSCNTVSS